MKVTVFQSDKGDCLLMQSSAGANVLVDGGMRSSFKTHVIPTLGRMARNDQVLDLVCVSHVDRDHIAGILELMNLTVAWRVYDYRMSTGRRAKKPALPRPPQIHGIWHNALSTLIGNNEGAIGDLMAQSASLLSMAGSDWASQLAQQHDELATSIAEAIELSHRISAEQLGIAHNEHFDGSFAMVREPAGHEAQIKGMKFWVIGPWGDDVDEFRDEWNDWLRENQARVKKLRDKARIDRDKLGTDISEISDSLANAIGNRNAVTTPNLASLMLYVKADDKTAILTGDGHADDIIEGLAHHGLIEANRPCHVDLLKIPHHGSEHNTTEDFPYRVTANHYVFCGNGAHHNPDLRVVRAYANAVVDQNREATFWFSSDTSSTKAGKNRDHMHDLELMMGSINQSSSGKVRSEFLSESKKTISL